jgi:hypothetical protein
LTQGAPQLLHRYEQATDLVHLNASKLIMRHAPVTG